MARPTIPDAVKKARGTLRKDRVNKNQPDPGAGKFPRLPRGRSGKYGHLLGHLDKAARAEYRRVTAIFGELGLGHGADLPAVAEYCQLYSDVVRLTLEVRKEGEVIERETHTKEGVNVTLVRNPKTKILDEKRARLSWYLGQFGFTSSSRQRLRIEKPPAKNPVDELAERRKKMRNRGRPQ